LCVNPLRDGNPFSTEPKPPQLLDRVRTAIRPTAKSMQALNASRLWWFDLSRDVGETNLKAVAEFEFHCEHCGWY
jgi:hypothetical protein